MSYDISITLQNVGARNLEKTHAMFSCVHRQRWQSQPPRVILRAYRFDRPRGFIYIRAQGILIPLEVYPSLDDRRGQV